MEETRESIFMPCLKIFEICRVMISFHPQNYSRYVTEKTKIGNRKKVNLVDFEKPQIQKEMHLNK